MRPLVILTLLLYSTKLPVVSIFTKSNRQKETATLTSVSFRNCACPHLDFCSICYDCVEMDLFLPIIRQRESLTKKSNLISNNLHVHFPPSVLKL